MPVNINFSPDAGVVAQSAYQGGLGDYNRWASGMALQHQQLDQQRMLAEKQMSVSEWQTQYGAASAQYMQAQGIDSQKTMQLRDLTNQDYLQQNSLANSRLMQLNDLHWQQYQQQQQQAFQAGQTAYTTGASLQSQTLAGNIHSALQGQAYNESLGLSNQSFDNQSALQNLEQSGRMAINRSNLQDQLDFLPQMSEAEYGAAQKQFSNRFQALEEAGPNGSGVLTQDEYQQARTDLLSSQLGLKQQMPTRTDFAKDFASNTYTDPNMTVSDGKGGQIPMRYIRNRMTGEVSIDPAMTSIINDARYGSTIKAKNMSNLFTHMSTVSGNVMKLTQQIMSSVEGIDPAAATKMAKQIAMESLQFGLGTAGQVSPEMEVAGAQ